MTKIIGLIMLVGIVIIIHAVACDMHVWAVDRAKMPHTWFYQYCRFVARLTRMPWSR